MVVRLCWTLLRLPDWFEVESVSAMSSWRNRSSGNRPAAFSSQSPVPCRTSVGIEAHAMFMAIAEMSAAVNVIDPWRAIIEQGGGVDGVNRQEPSGGSPQNGAEEIGGCLEQGILPIIEDATQVCIAIFQINARGIACCADVHQVVQVNFIGVVVLLVVKVELIRHFVCEEPGPVAGFFVGHGMDAGQSCEECNHQSE